MGVNRISMEGTMTTKFKCRTTLLEALGRFCYAPDGTRMHLATIYVSNTHLAATNGHRLVWVPNSCEHGERLLSGTIDAPFLIPVELVRHHAAGVRANWEEYVQGEFMMDGYTYGRNPIKRAETTVEVAPLDKYRVNGTEPATEDHRYNRVTLTFDGISISSECVSTVSEYPPFEGVLSSLTSEGTPVCPQFNPKLFVGMAELLEASDDAGLKMHAWDKEGLHVGPVEYRSRRGLRFIMMGYAMTHDEARRGHAQAAKRGTSNGASP